MNYLEAKYDPPIPPAPDWLVRMREDNGYANETPPWERADSTAPYAVALRAAMRGD